MRKMHLIYSMIAAFLLVLFAVFALPACGDKEGAGDGTDATSGGPDTGETQADVTGENTDVYRNIDRTKKYDGSFRVLSYDAKTWNI